MPVKCYCNPFALASFLFHFTTVVRVAGRVGAPPFTAAALGVSEVCEQQNSEVYRDDGCDGAEREKTKEAMEREGRSTAASLSLCSQAPPPASPRAPAARAVPLTSRDAALRSGDGEPRALRDSSMRRGAQPSRPASGSSYPLVVLGTYLPSLSFLCRSPSLNTSFTSMFPRPLPPAPPPETVHSNLERARAQTHRKNEGGIIFMGPSHDR